MAVQGISVTLGSDTVTGDNLDPTNLPAIILYSYDGNNRIVQITTRNPSPVFIVALGV